MINNLPQGGIKLDLLTFELPEKIFLQLFFAAFGGDAECWPSTKRCGCAIISDSDGNKILLSQPC